MENYNTNEEKHVIACVETLIGLSDKMTGKSPCEALKLARASDVHMNLSSVASHQEFILELAAAAIIIARRSAYRKLPIYARN